MTSSSSSLTMTHITFRGDDPVLGQLTSLSSFLTVVLPTMYFLQGKLGVEGKFFFTWVISEVCE